jgi:hypothetical protein
MVDIGDGAETPVIEDFGCRLSDSAAPGGWATGPVPTLTVRTGEGFGGSDRVTLVWDDGDILNQWLEVTVKSDANGGGLGLAADDVFYFGNIVGDWDGDGVVDATDFGALLGEFGQSGAGLAGDFNADGQVGLADFVILRSRFGETVATPTFPAAAPEEPAASPIAPLMLQTIVEPNTVIAAPTSPVLDQSNSAVDTEYISDGGDLLVTPLAISPAVDLLAVNLSNQLVEPVALGEYVSESQIASGPGETFAATGEYDLRPLGDDPGDDLLAFGESDGLADILAESDLAILPV